MSEVPLYVMFVGRARGAECNRHINCVKSDTRDVGCKGFTLNTSKGDDVSPLTWDVGWSDVYGSYGTIKP